MLAVTDILQLLSFFVSFYNRCVQAAPIPSVKTSCVPLQYNSYCSNKGILLDNFVFVKSDIQQENDKKLNRLQSNLDKFRALGFSLPEKCEKATNIVSCHHFYPRCDSTGDLYKAQRLCKETCRYFTYACSHELAMLNLLPQPADMTILSSVQIFCPEMLDSLQSVIISTRGLMEKVRQKHYQLAPRVLIHISRHYLSF